MRLGHAVLGLILAGFVGVACEAGDPGVEGLTRGQFSGDGAVTGDGASKGDSATTGDGAAGDAASDTTTAADAFTGAGAYSSQKPATSAVMFHNNNNVGVTPGLGQDCLTCHKSGGTGVEFLFAGTIFQDKAGTMPAVDKEVRVRGSDGVGYIGHSDDDGNFWFKKNASNLAFPAITGARDAAQTAFMTGDITATNCNGCHDGNTTDALHLP